MQLIYIFSIWFLTNMIFAEVFFYVQILHLLCYFETYSTTERISLTPGPWDGGLWRPYSFTGQLEIASSLELQVWWLDCSYWRGGTVITLKICDPIVQNWGSMKTNNEFNFPMQNFVFWTLNILRCLKNKRYMYLKI